MAAIPTTSNQYTFTSYLDQLPANFKKLLLQNLKKNVASGKLVKVKASFKLSAAAKKPAAKSKAAVKPKSKAKPAKINHIGQNRTSTRKPEICCTRIITVTRSSLSALTHLLELP